MVFMDRRQSFHSFSAPINRDLRGILSLKPYMSIESDKIKPFKDHPLSNSEGTFICESPWRQARPQRAIRAAEAARIPSPSFCVIQYESAGTYHCESDTRRSAESALMPSSCRIDSLECDCSVII